MSSKFFTNQDGNSLLNKFEGVFTYMQSIEFFDALVGYFRASGYFKVRPFLDRIQKIRILVGINVDRLTEEFHAKGQLYLANEHRTKDELSMKYCKIYKMLIMTKTQRKEYFNSSTTLSQGR